MKTISAFVLNDLKNIRREYMLIYILLIPIMLVFFLRLLLPPLTVLTIDSYGFSLTEYYPLLLSFFVIIEIPFIFGVVYGLFLLDEKDEDILTVLRVTPVSVNAYLRYRFTVIILLSIIFVSLGLPMTGVFAGFSYSAVLGTAFLGSLGGVLLTLIMIAFAGNKLEGLALMKGFGISIMAPMAGYFLESSWQLLLGVFPFYWPAKAFWLFSRGESGWFYLLVGAGYLSLLILFLWKRFKSRIGLSA